MIEEQYRQLVLQAGRLKLRALRLSALGCESEEECLTLQSTWREAAQQELQALSLLTDPSQQTQDGHHLEAAGCFLEAKDLKLAFEQWSLLSEEKRSNLPDSKACQRLKEAMESRE